MSQEKSTDEKLVPPRAETKLQNAFAFKKAGKYESALTALEEALAIEPNIMDAWLLKGIIYTTLGQCNESLKCYDKMIEMNPCSSVGLQLKGATLTMQNSHEKAAECFAKAVEIEPNNTDLRLTLASSFLKQKRFEEALRCYQEVLNHQPENPQIHYDIGIMLGNMGNYEKALGSFEEALKRKPDFSDAMLAKGLIAKIGRKEEAKECANKLLEIKKETANTQTSQPQSFNDACKQDYLAAQKRFRQAYSPEH